MAEAADKSTENNEAPENQEQSPGIRHGKSIPADQWGNDAITIEEPDVLAPTSAMREELETAANAEETEEESEEDKNDENKEVDKVETVDEPEDLEEERQFIEDPGEFKPNDYTFDVTVYDAEGKKPKTVKITSIDQWDELLESDPNFGTSSALMKAMRLSGKMERGLEEDKRTYEEKKKEYDEAVKSQQEYTAQVQTVANEMNYMAERGQLPKLTKDEQNMQWYKTGTHTPDPDLIKAHPNIKAWTDLVLYMRRESATRTKAGLPPLSSALDAFNAMQLDSRHQDDQTKKQQQAQARKDAAAKVSSASTTPLSATAPAGIKVGRNLGSIQRLGANWN